MSKTFPIIMALLCGLLLVSGCAPLKTPAAKPPPPPPSGEPDPITGVVVKADLIVLGTIADRRYEVFAVGEGETAGKFVHTIFTLSVEKVIKGNPTAKEVLIKVEGGEIDGRTVRATAGWYFSVTDRVLIYLERQDGDVFRLSDPGVAWIESTVNPVVPPAGLQETLGRIINVMRANNIAVALPRSEWPPPPAPTPASPPKK